MSYKFDAFGNRMKRYESAFKQFLPIKTPVIIRVDGKSFHNFTRGFEKPFDESFHIILNNTMLDMCKAIENCVFAYRQSDEISFVLADYRNEDTSSWFDNNVQKISSVSSSLATGFFNKELHNESCRLEHIVDTYIYDETLFDSIKVIDFDAVRAKANLLKDKMFQGFFDSRCFSLPIIEVVNYFIWRQNDAIRNSMNSLGRMYFTDKELNGLSSKDVCEKLRNEKKVEWNDLLTVYKRGCCCYRNEEGKWIIDTETPSFIQDRDYVVKHVSIGLYNNQ